MKTTTKMLSLFAIVALVSVMTTATIGTVLLSQQASALVREVPHHGCDTTSNGFIHSGGKCFHPDRPVVAERR